MARPREIEPQHVFAVLTAIFEDSAAAATDGMAPRGSAAERIRLVRRLRTMLRRAERMLDLVARIDRRA